MTSTTVIQIALLAGQALMLVVQLLVLRSVRRSAARAEAAAARARTSVSLRGLAA
jgi:hypothetical protein